MAAGSGSVRKRCAVFDCSNAVFTSAPECERCARVVAAIENFRKKSLDDLKSIIDKENGALVTPQPARVASAQVKSIPGSRKSNSTSGPFDNSAEPKIQSSSKAPLAKSPAAPKIVRIPDVVPVGDLVAAKKRAQTPGRPRAVHSQDE